MKIYRIDRPELFRHEKSKELFPIVQVGLELFVPFI